MPAAPSRIALSINDGVLLSKVSSTIKADHANAIGDDAEIESFFDTEADAQVLLDERWAMFSAVGRPRDQIELDSSLGLGTAIPVAPTVPNIEIVDEERNIRSSVCMVRAYAIDYNTDRYAVELMGYSTPTTFIVPGGGTIPDPVTPPGLDFSKPGNSQYLAAIGAGAASAPAPVVPSLKFNLAVNSQYVAAVAA